MGEKIRIPYVTDVVCINGVFQEERRKGDRRIGFRPWRFYERRKHLDPRLVKIRHIDAKV